MADLQDLLAKIQVPRQQPAGIQDLQPSVSSPVFSPQIQTPNPIHSSDVLSPANGSPAPDNRLHLINLFKSGSRAPSGPSHSQSPAPVSSVANGGSVRSTSSTSQRPMIAADLFASLQGQPTTPARASSYGLNPTTGTETENGASRAASQREALLKIFGQTKSPQPPAEAPSAAPKSTDNPLDILSHQLAQTSIGTPSASKPKNGIFTHVSPFEELTASSPRYRPTQPEPKIEVLKFDGDALRQNVQASATEQKQRKFDILARPGPERGQSVSQKLEDIAQDVDKAADRALARHNDDAANVPVKSIETNDVAANGNDEVDSSWESAEDEHSKEDNPVYSLPFKAWTSIKFRDTEVAKPIRTDNFMVIAQLKKEFDQIDRNLVTASQKHIVYAPLATKKDNGGLRIIHQDTGDHKQIFRTSGERIFNVQLCSPLDDSVDAAGEATGVETVIGTGVNGNVYWAPLNRSDGENFADDDVEAAGFVMAPVPTADEQASGSAVKTRVKLSNSHPDFFGLARGKMIHLIAPYTIKNKGYVDLKTRQVDSSRFLSEHGLKINTGKAGKDFAFSEDDSTIASLDKNGVVKFWDIRPFAEVMKNRRFAPSELTEPMYSISVSTSGTKAGDKPSVSSIMFVDRARPVTKGHALRFLLVGFKQNHILQLWDLRLGKAVQEIHLPQKDDGDGICSIAFHPRSGIITVGHPTRNSIYVFYFSMPSYKMSGMRQADFISQIARGDVDNSPEVQNTAIMTGFREYSLQNVGQLRSMDLLRHPVENASDPSTDDATIFELYMMHSKGVMGIGVKAKDIMTDVISIPTAIDAVKAGIVEADKLKPADVSAQPSAPSTTVAPTKPTPSVASAPAKILLKPTTKKEASPSPSRSSIRGVDGSTKQLFDASQPKHTPTTAPASTHANMAAVPLASKAPSSAQPSRVASPAPQKPTASASTRAAVSSADDKIFPSLDAQFSKLYSVIDNDRRVQDAASTAKQDALLRLVSSTLTENVEKSLQRIVGESIERDMLPRVTTAAARSVEVTLSPQIERALKLLLPSMAQQVTGDAQFQRAISDQVAGSVQQKVSSAVDDALRKQQAGLFSEMEKLIKAQSAEAERIRAQDSAKIDELSNLVRGLSSTISSLVATQSSLQQELSRVKSQQNNAPAPREPSPSRAASMPAAQNSSSPSTTQADSQEDPEVQTITQLLIDGHYDTATLSWLQSTRQAALFDLIFSRVNPAYLSHVTPLIALSVSAAITASFDTHLEKRLDWLTAVMRTLDLQDPDIRDVAPRIMDVLASRLQGAYGKLVERGAGDGVLRRIAALNRQVGEVKRLSA